MEPKIGETYVYGDIDPVKFPNKPVWTVKEVDMDAGGWVVLSNPKNDDWKAELSQFYSYFTKIQRGYQREQVNQEQNEVLDGFAEMG